MKETPKAQEAFSDYVALGPKRSLSRLVELYQTRPEGGPTRQLSQLKKWSVEHSWQDRLAAAEEARRERIMRSGYALDHLRVEKLNELAELLTEELADPDLRWLKEKRSIVVGQQPVVVVGEDGQERMIGRIPQYETFWLQRPNRAWVEQARGLLDDLAQETGGRIRRTELTGKDGEPVAVKVYTDPRMDNPLEADWSDAPPPRNTANP